MSAKTFVQGRQFVGAFALAAALGTYEPFGFGPAPSVGPASNCPRGHVNRPQPQGAREKARRLRQAQRLAEKRAQET